MSTEEEIEILYNKCYGCWTLSDEAKKLYMLRKKCINVDEIYCTLRSRCDPILIQIYYELGDDFDYKMKGSISNSKIKKITKKYKDYYDIEEFHGFENVIIDYTKYALDNLTNKIKEILQNPNNNDEKINKIQQIISNCKI